MEMRRNLLIRNFLGTIRYIPDEESPSEPLQKNQKARRNGNDSDSDEEVAAVASETRVNGHGHHRSSRKKSKSGKIK